MLRRCFVVATLCLSLGALSNAHAADDAEDAPAPIPGQVELRGTRVVFHWSSVAKAKEYHLQVARSVLFHPANFEKRTAVTNAQTPRKKLPLDNYFWRVSAVGPDGSEGPFSAAQPLTLTNLSTATTELTTPAPVSMEKLVKALVSANVKPRARPLEYTYACAPDNGQAPATVKFRWTEKKARRVEVATDEAFNNIVSDSILPKGKVTLKIKPGAYHYRWAPYRGWREDPPWTETQRFPIRCDDIPPPLELSSLPPRVFTTQPGITVEGISDWGAHVTLNDHDVDVTDRGEFIFHLALQPGRNELMMVARDAAGNETHRNVSILMLPVKQQQHVVSRLTALQAQLVDLDVQRVQQQQRGAALASAQGASMGPEVVRELKALEVEWKEERATKRALASEIASALLELQPTQGLKFPPPGAVLQPVPEPKPPPPPVSLIKVGRTQH